MGSDDEQNHARERELGMDRPIARRDFLNGVALGIGGALGAGLVPGLPGLRQMLAATGLDQDTPGYYPPALTGMRGSHDGSYDVSHALRDGRFFDAAPEPMATGESYDLVVVGGGISGLAAAFFYRTKMPAARILILDNHDDFGGHAKRNEFRPGGRLWIANGGTESIESPFVFSAEARELMRVLDIHPKTLARDAEKAGDRSAFADLRNAFFFDKETFGTDRLVVGLPPGGKKGTLTAWRRFLAATSLSPRVQQDIARLQTAKVDYLKGLSNDEKKERLSRVSYRNFLLEIVKVDPEVVPFYQSRTHALYGVGIDAVGALEGWAYGYPGFAGMQLDSKPTGRMSYTARGSATKKPDYEFHFPDGNATIARLLVRALIPDALPGSTVEDSVLATANYHALDRPSSAIRIRLGSTAVRVRQTGPADTPTAVDVVYGRDAKVYAVRAAHVVLACWNAMIPYICPELPDEQKAALKYGVKVPLVYTTVALNNWRAFRRLGLRNTTSPGMYHSTMRLEIPTVIGGYDPTPKSPDDPILIRMTRTPCKPGLPARDQHRAGHVELLTTPFRTFELRIRDQMTRALGGGGFDAARDIDAITVNRWPHGYAYEYNPLWDRDWDQGEAPCEIGRKRFGRIAIANSDAGAAAYTDSAIDQAFRAVIELTDAAG